MGLKAKVNPHKYKKARYAIVNVSKKDLSKVIREFKKLPYESYEKKRPKHETTDSYFYLARQLAKCMMRTGGFNSHVYPLRTEMTDPSSHVCSADEDESKRSTVNETLSHSCSTDKGKSKHIIVNKTLS